MVSSVSYLWVRYLLSVGYGLRLTGLLWSVYRHQLVCFAECLSRGEATRASSRRCPERRPSDEDSGPLRVLRVPVHVPELGLRRERSVTSITREKLGSDECLLVVAVRLVVADTDVHLCDRGFFTTVA